MGITKGKLDSLCIKQMNDASCFNARSNGSANKRAKRHSSKIRRQYFKRIDGVE
jgi:hypothetical protein